MKIEKCLWITLSLMVCLTYQIFAQPYYYYNAGTKMTAKIMRINLQTGTNELVFVDDSNSCGDITWDPTQNWLFISGDIDKGDREGGYLRFIINILNTSIKQIIHRFPDEDTSQVIGYVHYANPFRIIEDPLHPLGKVQSFTRWSWTWLREGKRVLDGIVYNPIKNIFYVTYSIDFLRSDYASWDSTFIFQKTVVYDASTFQVLDTLSVPPGWITSLSSVSDDGNYLYVEKWGYQEASLVGKYSIPLKQLIFTRKISDIYVPGGYKGIDDSKKGRFLLEFLYPNKQLSDKKYAIYDIDRDTTYAIIPFPPVSNGSLSSDGKYIIIEETPVKPKKDKSGDRFLHPGRISVYNGKTGSLLQKLTLPPNGKVLVFDNYPNMFYYYLPNEQRSINIDLSKPAVSITSLNPINVSAGSGAFTLTVKGMNFVSGSTINWNNSVRTTTFVADSILQANILASDVTISGTALVSVINPDGGTSNSMPFVIRQSFTITINTVGNGSVTMNPNQTKYDSASVVQLTATSQQGSVFSGWSGDLTGTATPVNLLMNANKSVTATFVASIWTNKDIGSPALAGSTTIVDGVFTVKGAGTDVAGTTDQFQFAYQALNGDGEIIAKVNSVTNTNTSAKAGVMIRESLNANSRFTFIMQRPDKQVQFDARTSTGGTAVHISTLQGGTTNIKFLRLVRSGNSFSAYYSTSSATGPWTSLGTSAITMTTNVQMGLFVTSHTTSALCTGVFGQVVIPPVQYTLTTSVAGQGSISLNPSGGKYNLGTNVTVTATAASGWTFSGWSGDLTGTTNPATLTMNGNKSVTATFAPIPVWTNDGPTTFDGTSTYVDGGTSPGSASSLTVAFFMTAHKLANMGPVDKLPTTGTAGWSVKLRSNGDLWFRIGSDGTKTDVTKTGAYSANTRVHIACTFGSGTAKIYVNGVLVTTKNSVTYTVNNTTTHLRLGIPSVAATTDKFDGVLEQVKIYNQVLTDAQISGLAAVGK